MWTVSHYTVFDAALRRYFKPFVLVFWPAALYLCYSSSQGEKTPTACYRSSAKQQMNTAQCLVDKKTDMSLKSWWRQKELKEKRLLDPLNRNLNLYHANAAHCLLDAQATCWLVPNRSSSLLLCRDHPLLGLPNVLITPHVGTNTYTTIRKMVQMMVEDALAALKGQSIPNEVKPKWPHWWYPICQE